MLYILCRDSHKYSDTIKVILEKLDNVLNGQKIQGIKSIKINKIVGSLTVEYDPIIFPPRMWDNLVQGKELDEIVQILNTLSKEFV